MADLPKTICFKSSVWMVDRLREIARREKRTIGQVVRLIVEEKLVGQLQSDHH